jgi:hypothetical protein
MDEKIVGGLTDALNSLADKAEGAVQSLPGPAATADPKVAAAKTPQEAYNSALAEITIVLQAQAAEALTALASLSQALAKKGAEIVQEIARVGALYAAQKIDKATAELAVDNLIAAMQLLGVTEVNAVKMQAYIRATKTLQTVKSILLALIQMGLNMLVPTLGNFLQGLDIDALIAKAIPTPKPQA